MAFLMSDMAAGSDAVRTLQQNAIGSQYDAQNAKSNADFLAAKAKVEASSCHFQM